MNEEKEKFKPEHPDKPEHPERPERLEQSQENPSEERKIDLGNGTTMTNRGNVVTISENMEKNKKQVELWQLFLDTISGRKVNRLEKIMELAKARQAQGKHIKNDNVEKLLRVSDATATRYLEELVKARKLKREGNRFSTSYFLA